MVEYGRLLIVMRAETEGYDCRQVIMPAEIEEYRRRGVIIGAKAREYDCRHVVMLAEVVARPRT